MTTIEVGYSTARVSNFAVILNTGKFKMWGTSSASSKKKWNFPSSKYNLIGLYGAQDGNSGISMLGTIVYKAE